MVLGLQNNSLFRKTHTHTHTKARSDKYHNAKNLTLKFYRKKKRKTKHWLFFTDRSESGDGKWEFVITSFSHLCFFANKKKLLKSVSSINFAWSCHHNRVLGIFSVSTHSVHGSVLPNGTTASDLAVVRTAWHPLCLLLGLQEDFTRQRKILQLKLKCYRISITFSMRLNSNKTNRMSNASIMLCPQL